MSAASPHAGDGATLVKGGDGDPTRNRRRRRRLHTATRTEKDGVRIMPNAAPSTGGYSGEGAKAPSTSGRLREARLDIVMRPSGRDLVQRSPRAASPASDWRNSAHQPGAEMDALSSQANISGSRFLIAPSRWRSSFPADDRAVLSSRARLVIGAAWPDGRRSDGSEPRGAVGYDVGCSKRTGRKFGSSCLSSI